MTTSLRLQSHLLRSAVALQLLPCDIILHVTSTGLSVTGKYVCSLLLKFIIMIVCHSGEVLAWLSVWNKVQTCIWLS